MGIPRIEPLRRADLVRFDLIRGLPAAMRVLRRRVGALGLARTLAALTARAGRDPLAHLPTSPAWTEDQEALTRHQLRTVVHMDDIAREVLKLSDERRLALLRDLVAGIGAQFVDAHVPEIQRSRWASMPLDERKQYARTLAARFFNSRMELVDVDDERLALDVTACRFVELCEALGRPYLAPFFCEADSRHFDRPGSLVTLRRSGTIAHNAPRCDFRFRFRDAADPTEAPDG